MKTARNILLALIGFLLVSGPQISFAFVDVDDSHIDYRPIAILKLRGVVEGEIGEDGKNYYYPEKNINRAEYVTLIARATDLIAEDLDEGERVFEDVIAPVWYSGPVWAAKKAGIISGDDGKDSFRPGDSVAYSEAAKVALLADGRNVRDKIDQEEWYQPYIDYAHYYRLPMVDSPDQKITRAFMARFMYELSRRTEDHDIRQNVEGGQASHYGEAFDGRGTASGEVYDSNRFTAAHRTLPFGTWVKVTNPENGHSVHVKINDRGPYAEDRIIDLSPAAFQVLAPLSVGVTNVVIETFPEPSPDLSPIPDISDQDDVTPCPEIPPLQNIESNTFDNITLDTQISNLYLQNQVLRLSGQVNGDQMIVTSFLMDEENQQHVTQAEVIDQRFEMFINFPHSGIFRLGLLPGNGGSAKVKDIHVLPVSCFAESDSGNIPAPSDLDFRVDSGRTAIHWQGQGNLTRFIFKQDHRIVTLISDNQGKLVVPLRPFQGFVEGEVQLTVQNAFLQEGGLFGSSQTNWGTPVNLSFNATLHRRYEFNRQKLELSQISQVSNQETLKLSFNPHVPVQAEAGLILPTGLVQRIPLSSPTHSPVQNNGGMEVLPAATEEVHFNYLPSQEGVYIIEINDENGLALLNAPIYGEGFFPLLPNPADLSDRTPVDLGDDLFSLNGQMLDLVNQHRLSLNRGALELDTVLMQMAQDRADDMAQNGYFSHTDLNGKTIYDTRGEYGIVQSVSENLAKETTIELAMFGLTSSAIHLENMLLPVWGKAGFGFAKNPDGSYIMVQIFSTLPVDMDHLEGLREVVLQSVNEKRNHPLMLYSVLNDPAQIWAQKMVEEDFFQYQSPSGETFNGLLEEKGIDEALGTYLVGSSNFESALAQILQNDQTAESRWHRLGVGIWQNALGIKIMLIYGE